MNKIGLGAGNPMHRTETDIRIKNK